MRVDPPKAAQLYFTEYDPEWSTEEVYSRDLMQQAHRLLTLRDAELASMAEITDIIHKADQICLPLYDYFERTSAHKSSGFTE